MKTKSIGGYTVTVYSIYDGDDLYIEKNGVVVYKCRTNRYGGFEFARWIINNRLNK